CFFCNVTGISMLVFFTGVSCVHASCPIELSPSSVAVRYGDPVSVNCSTTVSHHGIGWEASYGGTGAEEVNQLSWTLENLTEWDISPSCFINPADSEQCMENLKIVVYTFPEKIQISSSNGSNGQMTEGKEYDIICEIPNIAPVQNLTVKWYKGDRIIKSDTFENTTFKHSVNASPRLSFKPSRQDSGARFRCEAQMDLRPVGPHFNVSSKEYNITVFCKYILNYYLEIHSGSTAELKCASRGYPRLNYTWHYYQTANVMEENEDGVSLLKIHHANADNMGSYTCDAWNSKGNVSKTVRVTVIGRCTLNDVLF
uniref:Ig-like domain-containing protein n=1 Tax=Amphilophus citrinellus TaxID=61819 RepID=A0A3Q0RFJ6_AMPCI